MADIIKLKPGVEAPESLARGELALDQEGRLLYVDLGASSGPVALPLDVLPPPEADDAGVLTKTVSSASYRPLSAGGGGRPFDDQPWRAPGLVITDFGSQLVAASLAGVIEVGLPVQVLSMMCRPSPAAVLYTFGIRTMTGDVIEEVSASAAGGPTEEGFSGLLLDTGRYELFVTCAAPLTFAVARGLRRHQSTSETVAVFLNVI